MTTTPASAVHARGLTRRFGDFTAVDGLDLDVPAGEIFGFLGANGAGKTTAIRMLCGLLAPSGGEAVVAGVQVGGQAGGRFGGRFGGQARELKRRIGYMSQRFSLYDDLTVAENLEFFGGIYGLFDADLAERRHELLPQLGLADLERRLAGSLPLGFKQRLALGCALLHRPRVVFLDEPTGGVDPVARRRFWDLIYEQAAGGVTVFVTTHYMDEAEYCGRVGLMVAGRLAALDTPAGLEHTFAPGKVWVLRGPSTTTADARARLRAVPGVVDVQPIGAGLRVRVRDDAPITGDTLAAALPGPVEFEADAANLEDVFLAVVDALIFVLYPGRTRMRADGAGAPR